MDFVDEITEREVSERRFELEVDGEAVPGIVWSPEGAAEPRPLVLVGHGGTQHKRTANVLGLARRLVRHQGYVVVGIDAPDHGDRAPADATRISREERRRQMAQMSPEERAKRLARMSKGVDEWKATLDSLVELDIVDAERIGYWGVSMGTAIGLPFVASEPRVRAAVLGLAGLGNRPGQEDFERAARSLRIPVLFVFQWEDELMSRESGIALFDAIGSEEKTMHINPGPHVGIPLFERDDYELFYVRHLGVGHPSAERSDVAGVATGS